MPTTEERANESRRMFTLGLQKREKGLQECKKRGKRLAKTVSTLGKVSVSVLVHERTANATALTLETQHSPASSAQ